MARKDTPALYELLGRGRDAKAGDARSPSSVPIKVPPRAPGPSGVGVRTPATPSTSSNTARPSTTRARLPLQLPSWKAIGVAFALVVVVLGYQFATSRGPTPDGGEEPATQPTKSNGSNSPGTNDATARGGVGDAAATPEGMAPQGARSDPSGSSQPTKSRSTTPQPNGAGGQGASENPASDPRTSDPELGAPLGPMQKGVDPRQAGLNYYVLASVLEANADRMVQFCRDRGLDAWVVPDHNGRLREITVLPGIPKSELDGARAKALKARILKVGLQWKAAGRGNADFGGCYPKLYNG